MTMQATARKIKRSFTLAPECVAFVEDTRQRRQAGSDSEALDLLLREAMLEVKRQELEAGITAYYDSITDEEMAEEREWAEMAGSSLLLSAEPYGAGI
ncbi:MAG: hypothetical protein WB424_18910 [Terracidiphilus sp.]